MGDPQCRALFIRNSQRPQWPRSPAFVTFVTWGQPQNGGGERPSDRIEAQAKLRPASRGSQGSVDNSASVGDRGNDPRARCTESSDPFARGGLLVGGETQGAITMLQALGECHDAERAWP
jgi:hypothetical protein